MAPDMVSRSASTNPSQQMPVASADGKSSRHASLPPSSSHMENHQKAVCSMSDHSPTKADPPTLLSQGSVQPLASVITSAAASQMTCCGVCLNPRASTSKTRSYSS